MESSEEGVMGLQASMAGVDVAVVPWLRVHVVGKGCAVEVGRGVVVSVWVAVL